MMKRFIFALIILIFCGGASSSSREADIYKPKKVVILRVTDFDGSVILQREL